MRLNTLSYGLLALLSASPLTGYDLAQKIKPLWQAGHSQIYPLLAALEQNGYIAFERIEQQDKPDKKEYSITDKGLTELGRWVELPAENPVLRDELHFKLYGLWLSEPEKAKALLVTREAFCRSELERYDGLMRALEEKRISGKEARKQNARLLGRYLLISKRMMDTRTSLAFCEWAMKELEASEWLEG
ncbi:hypothetical protein BBD42_13615 [Paenibacillus sp. BIHB 4019]|uniref:PadR family transcriptional regulator n=1 Tax=Paenibacillus sp. BIHB 4019 TaxID=1870819 RepID=A0A1B2DI37_9BACL|nr:PadR family transcriptional regulator [Paenibacillus sp. BIHB 4019]ANY67397.1 hypothetical protein BBD42_13615 [Paenibacillus sp. BIHB 4019]